MKSTTVPASKQSPDAEKLLDTIHDVITLQRTELAKIAAVARLGMAAVQAGNALTDAESIYRALETIWGISTSLSDMISVEFESVGVFSLDVKAHERWRTSMQPLQ